MLIIALIAVHPARSAEDKPFKLSIGEYWYSAPDARYTGQDLNLRYRTEDSSFWIGQYHDPAFGHQTRAGADTSFSPWNRVDLAIQPSVQVATGGFVGGSLNLQYGRSWFALAGIGRTNLRPYQNLNFDPNDAITVGVGYHSPGGNTFSVTTIGDDRLGTGQRDTHALIQLALPHGQRATMDLMRKTGRGDSGRVDAWGETLTYDFPSWFLRAAYDPRQNFGTANATRLTVGARF